MNPLQSAGIFLIGAILDLYLLVLLLRLILQYLRVDYYNPFTQFIVKATSKVVVPLRRIIPGFWGIDFATIAAIIIVSLIKLTCITLIAVSKLPFPIGLVVWVFADIISLTIKLFFYAILLNVILSWIAPLSRSPMSVILFRLTEPLLRPCRRIIPPISGFDLSPIVVLIGLELLSLLIANPLSLMGRQLAIY